MRADTVKKTTKVERHAFNDYLQECDDCAIVPDAAGAFHWAWSHQGVVNPVSTPPTASGSTDTERVARELCRWDQLDPDTVLDFRDNGVQKLEWHRHEARANAIIAALGAASGSAAEPMATLEVTSAVGVSKFEVWLAQGVFSSLLPPGSYPLYAGAPPSQQAEPSTERTLLQQYDREQRPGYQDGWKDGRLYGYEVGKRHAADAASVSGKDADAWMTRNDDGDPAMLFFDLQEARTYTDGEEPEALILREGITPAASKGAV